MRLGRRSLSGIPRIALQGRHPTQEVDSRNRPLPRTYTPFDLLVCTVQPYIGKDLSILEDGYNTRDIRTVFTETKCSIGKEGSDQLADEVLIDETWFKVIKAQPWQTGIISHYALTVVELDEVLNE